MPAIPVYYTIDTVVAPGHRAEEPIAEEMIDTIKYWLDGQKTLHVPA
jgi:hypothetical protein